MLELPAVDGAALLGFLSAYYPMQDKVDFSLTSLGIWAPTPLDVIVAAAPYIYSALEQGLAVMDAGCGDGRWILAMAWWAAQRSLSARILGIECDEFLGQLAQERLSSAGLCGAASILVGDYLEHLANISAPPDVLFNYPDGQEHALARCLSERTAHQGGAQLWLISPQLHIALEHGAAMPPHTLRRMGVAPPWFIHHFLY